MKLLIINGSPNKDKGGTYATVKVLTEEIAAIIPNVSIEMLYLRDVNQPYCDGCLSCLKKGGDTCPVRGSVLPVEDRIRDCDAFILAAPVHSFNIGAQTKTMIDLFVKEIHRPSFFGKKAIVVATANGGGQPGVLKYMRNTLSLWGVHVVAKIGSSTPQLDKPEYGAKLRSNASKAAKALVDAISKAEHPSPALIDLISFQIMRIAITSSIDEVPLDHTYWKERGWLTADYFTGARINPVKNMLAKLVGSMVGLQIRRGKSKSST